MGLPEAPIAWDDARIFIAIARQGSIAAASKTLGIDHATVSRRLSAFDAAMGLPLVVRTRLGVRLTDEGATILSIAARAEEPMIELQRHRDATLPSGRVRMATSSILSVGLLAPHVPAFDAENPGLQLDLVVGRRLVDLTRREADVALRLRPPGKAPAEPNIVVTRLASVGFALYGAHAQVQAPAKRFVRYAGATSRPRTACRPLLPERPRRRSSMISPRPWPLRSRGAG